MSERYQRILSIDDRYFNADSPIYLEKAALLFDQKKDINIFQAKYINICEKEIIALYIEIECQDISKKKLGTVQGVYLDLNVPRNTSFGDNIPIEISYSYARKFKFKISKIIFADGEVYDKNIELVAINDPYKVEVSNKLVQQFIREFKSIKQFVECKNLFSMGSEYWYCPCGTLNTINDCNCRSCKAELEKVKQISDNEYLKLELDKYIENEKYKEKLIKKNEYEMRKALKMKYIKMACIIFAVLATTALISGIWLKYQYHVSYSYVENYIKNKADAKGLIYYEYKDSSGNNQTFEINITDKNLSEEIDWIIASVTNDKNCVLHKVFSTVLICLSGVLFCCFIIAINLYLKKYKKNNI